MEAHHKTLDANRVLGCIMYSTHLLNDGSRVQTWSTPRVTLTPLCLLSPAAAFENVVQALYKYVVPKPRSECSKPEQLGVSFAAGYIAGVLCAIVSHPADNLVSKLNATKGVSAGA